MTQTTRHRVLMGLLILIGSVVPPVLYAFYGHTGEIPTAAPYRPSPLLEQYVAVLSVFGLKFFYTSGATAIIVVLWRRTAADLAALRWAMICFFIGENCCLMNVVLCGDGSLPLEYLHNLGMVLTFAFTTYALLEGIDARLIHYSAAGRCAAAPLCRGCIKHADVPCGLRRIFLLLVPALALVAALPLFVAYRTTAYQTTIFGAPYTYQHPVVEQIYEWRLLPIAALLLLAACFLVLWLVERHPVPLSKILLAAAVGAMGFAFFRLLLVTAFIDDQVWFEFWEEATELLYVGVAGGLLLVYRHSLLAPEQPRGTATLRSNGTTDEHR